MNPNPIFAEAASPITSGRYTFVPTSTILSAMEKEGWNMVDHKVQKTRKPEKAGFQKHMLKLTHRDYSGTAKPEQPQIVLINSHDGSSSLRLYAGLFVLVCTNGLVRPTSAAEGFTVRHTGDLDPIIEQAYKILYGVPQMMDSVSRFKSAHLLESQQKEFALKAAGLRYPDGLPVGFDSSDLLRPNRAGDDEPSLWKTLNRVQENLMVGGLRYEQVRESDSRLLRRRTRRLTSIDRNVAVNTGLWALAEEVYAEVVG